MRILRISLRNLASLAGTQTIDFTRDPLRTAGLFSISGPTGSGKSTILDALCLALYERTPRLEVIRGTVKLVDGGDSISQQDPANLLRRGAGEGYAEVAFVGVDNATYTARWIVRRARGRPDGALQNTQMALLRGDVQMGTEGTIEQGGRKTEVLPVIEARVGLSFEQFTRAVLLAQNDFATFLKADDKERAEILQALTRTERFEAISIATFTRCASEQRAASAIEARLAGNAPFTPETRGQAQSVSLLAEAALTEATEKLTGREAHAVWFTRLAELSDGAVRAQSALVDAQRYRDAAAPRRLELDETMEASRDARPLRDAERRTSAETVAAEKSRNDAATAEADARANLGAKRERYDAATAAFVCAKSGLDDAQPLLRHARDLDSRLLPLGERLALAQRELESAEAILKQAIERQDDLLQKRRFTETERSSLASKRFSLASLAPFAPDATAWLDRLDRATAAQKWVKDAETELAHRSEAEMTKARECAAEGAKEPATRTAAEVASSALATAEAAAHAYDGERIAAARREADAARAALRQLQNQLRELHELSLQAGTLKAEIAKLESENETDHNTLADLKKQRILAAEHALTAARRSFELAEAAVADAAIRLRERLTPEGPCPVCGAVEHPYAEHPPASEAAALRALRDDCLTREKALTALRALEAGLHSACQTRLGQRSDKLKAVAVLTDRLTTARSFRHEHPAAGAILALPEMERGTALGIQLAAEEEAVRALDLADTARRTAEKQRDDCRAQRDKTTQALAALEKTIGEFSTQLARLQSGREAAEDARRKAEDGLRTSLGELAPLFTGLADAAQRWKADPATFRRSFSDGLAALLILDKRLGELDALARETEAALIPVQEALGRAETERTAKRSAETVAHSAHETVRTQRTAILAGRPADTIEAELKDLLRRAAESHELRTGELAQADKLLAAAAEAHKAAGIVLAERSERCATAATALDAWLLDFAARTQRTIDRGRLETVLARDDAWIKTERATLDAMEGAIRTAEGALAVHQKALDAHLAVRPTSDAESTVTADLATLREVRAEAEHRRDSARSILLADDQRRATCADLARELDARKLAAQPWERLNELIGSADGAKFRSIAQRRTLDILLGYANAQLDQLAARYRLERVSGSLNLIVLDRDMGDERRSVHSLSGGECFLVSLALALGLASLTSNRLRIESLFIDEGFGSLDPETLNTAMSALMHLEAQGRKVGVISHVAEMADAIPVQIRVIKGRSGASRVIVPSMVENPMLNLASPDLVEDSPEGYTSASLEAVAAQILSILRREEASGALKVSLRALREELGCTVSVLSAAREMLIRQVHVDGKSLALIRAAADS